MLIKGSENGVDFEIHDGLITFKLSQDKEIVLRAALTKAIRWITSNETPTGESLEKINRMSRIAWQGAQFFTLKDLDAADCEILYDIPTNPNLQWIWSILNRVRAALQKAKTTPDMCDEYAKRLAHVMDS